MIISRTPYRLSFFGGGTDYPAWFQKHGGAVLATTIDKYCYLTCRNLPPFFDNRYRIVYSKVELCQALDEIQHPSVRETLRRLEVQGGLEISHQGDLPARSGMASSSAFTVGILHALRGLQGQMPGKEELARESIYIEQELLKETVGCQDQIMAAYGGFNHITFLSNGDFSLRPVTVLPNRLQELNAHLMLFFTGLQRTADGIAATIVQDIEAKSRHLRIMKDMVDEGISILCSGQDITRFGELLHESWQLKRGLSPDVSNEHIDGLYDKARKLGAVGGKIAGAGGGGFLLLFAPPDRQAAIREEFLDLVHVPFQFEYTGSQIIYYHPDTSYAEEEALRLTHAVAAFQESVRAAAA